MRGELFRLPLLYPPRTHRAIINFSSTASSFKSFKAYTETCASLLKECSSRKSLSGGQAIHGHTIKAGISSQHSLSAEFLTMYSNCGRLTDCNKVFEEFGSFDLFSWNFMISACVRCGDLGRARRLFDEMPVRNDISWTVMIDGHMKCGRIHDSVEFLERNPYRTVVSWTATINGLVQNGLNSKALMLLCRMLESGVAPNEITFTSVIRACVAESNFGLGQNVVGLIVKAGFERYISVCNSLITLHLRMNDLQRARIVFDEMEERDVISWTTILDVYFQIGELKEARRLFDEMPMRNEVSWSTMIARYTQNGKAIEALKLFECMIHEGFKPNTSCFASVLSASAGLKNLLLGTNVHGLVLKDGLEEDVYISSALIDMYFKCGNSQVGRQVFDLNPYKNVVCWNSLVAGYSYDGEFEEVDQLFSQIPTKNTVSWNAVISGYVENENYNKVLDTFDGMLISQQMPNQTTFSSVLRACATLSLLEKGRNIHGKILKLGIQDEVFMGTALTDMYAKSGDIESSRRVFCQMPEKNEISWSAIIQGLADNGLAEDSIRFFNEMTRTVRVPTEIPFLSVLYACSHCGFVDQGFQFFESMRKVYGITPTEKHYTCMVDLLARGGHLREAEKFISKMPLKPEANSWAALLSACYTYGNDAIGERAAKKLLELEKENSAGHVLLSNIYASSRRWEDAGTVRTLMREAGIKKYGGYSWIVLRNQFHKFFSWDACHQKSLEIYQVLDILMFEIMS